MCTVFGVWHRRKAAEFVYLGLHAQQHRAVEYAGIVATDGANFYREAGAGIVQDVFDQPRLDRLHGQVAIGHLRYATVEDDPQRDNTQPIVGFWRGRPVAIAHNGNITNVPFLREQLASNARLATSIDTELILRRFCLSQEKSPVAAIKEALREVRGTYALVLLLPDCMIAVRDRSGNRPLSFGMGNGSYFVASETCAFEAVEANYVRDIAAGEIVCISDQGITTDMLPNGGMVLAQCRFEGIYYASPASRIFGEDVAQFRLRLGRKLEELCPVPGGEVVVAVPDSANFIAQGYALSGRSGRFGLGILRHHYIGRSFIEGNQYLRNVRASRKFIVVPSEVNGKVVVVADDSIVRLTTMPLIVRRLKNAGAREVHVRIGSPPITHPCHYGIDTPSREELAANNMTVDQMREHIEASSLEFLPIDALYGLAQNPKAFCYACMNGNYPVCLEP